MKKNIQCICFFFAALFVLLPLHAQQVSKVSQLSALSQKHAQHQAGGSFSRSKVAADKWNTMRGYSATIGGSPQTTRQTAASHPLKQPLLFNKSKIQQYPKDLQVIEVQYADALATPVFVRLQANDGRFRFVNEQTAVVGALDLLHQFKALFRLNDAPHEMQLISAERDNLGIMHLRFQQQVGGIPVYGKQILVHFTTENDAVINGRYLPTPQVASLLPYFTPENTAQAALADLQTRTTVRQLSDEEKKLLHYQQASAELVIWAGNNEQIAIPKLAYRHTIRPNFLERWEYFVDAQTGEILNFYNNTCTEGPSTAQMTDLNGVNRTINTYQVGSTYYMIDGSRQMFNLAQSNLPEKPVGGIWCINANNTGATSFAQVTSSNNVWNSPRAASAQYNAGQCYEYYRTTHNRNSLNGQGGTIISVINVTQNGQQMDNAFWNGQFMAYGNGDQAFTPLAGALDVAGHEMTHGVIENNSAGGLEYQGQSGALNESFADVFGAMIDRNDWKMGEDIVQSGVFPGGALRDLQNPHNGCSSSNCNGWQPSSMSEYENTSQDNGGVHSNSGIPNRAFYLFATAVTKEKAERVYYRALTQYMTNHAQFLDMRNAVIQSATDLYGNNSYEAQSAGTAFDGVGIFGGASNNNNAQNDNYPPVNGTDWIAAYSYLASDPNAFYMIKSNNPTNNDFHPLTQSVAANNPTFPDDGSVGLFVGQDNNLYAFSTDYNNPGINQLTDSGDYGNVALSRDGNKMAVVSNSLTDANIYVYNFVTEQWHTFQLYNPTYSGVENGTARYADALDWDFTGEYVLYDAYSEINNTSGGVYGYWDVNFMHVWNSANNTAADGTVEKLFSSLPNGVSIGNPIFSKNSPYIVAFDYIEGNSYALLGANLNNGDVGTILSENATLGVPSYSRLDDAICFTTNDNNGNPMVAKISMAADKINSSGNPAGFASNMQWGTWFSIGQRPSSNCVGFAVNVSAQGSTQICSGGNVVLDAGAGYASYAWSGGGNQRFKTVSSAGNYVVTVTLNGCSAVSPPVVVSIRPNPTANFTTSVNASLVQCTNTSSSATEYLWNFGDGSTSTEPNPTHNYTSTGNKTITLTASNPCASNTTTRTVTISVVGIEPVNTSLLGTVLPNPSTGYLAVCLKNAPLQATQVTVYDLGGKCLLSEQHTSDANGSFNLDLRTCHVGVYLIEFVNDKGKYTELVSLLR